MERGRKSLHMFHVVKRVGSEMELCCWGAEKMAESSIDFPPHLVPLSTIALFQKYPQAHSSFQPSLICQVPLHPQLLPLVPAHVWSNSKRQGTRQENKDRSPRFISQACCLAQLFPGIKAAHPKKSAIGKRNSPSLGQRQEFYFPFPA